MWRGASPSRQNRWKMQEPSNVQKGGRETVERNPPREEIKKWNRKGRNSRVDNPRGSTKETETGKSEIDYKHTRDRRKKLGG